ncbi:MAG TPA: glycosyl hydrolase family 57 [Kiritimatiellia bacterium]|nr:glycosyl hydrolase family 57 [Kiritimatiellia bacterium]HMP00236.1 glycosyl hydrolase family 57 [Kiritimatiellia bacterium]
MNKIYFGIHKHMHQPYYHTTDATYWDGEKDGIFGTRRGAYSEFLADAIERYVSGDLAHAGISTSWSGSLIEQLNRCEREGLCGGQFNGWKTKLRQAVALTTARGNPRLDFTAFGFFHPLMPLIPARNIVRQIQQHRAVVEEHFGIPASRILFPPETAFHVRMIPALKQAGIEAVIYDSIHRARACREYPYGGPNEGMLPPNPAEQENPPRDDWYPLQNVWAASRISPGLLKPEYVHYEDPEGNVHRIIAVPAERYLGNEDARGGFGALQYPDCFGQLHAQLSQRQAFDPKHPPFFLLHSDGDNYGGGADSYYRHNTEQLVRWLQQDPRFELISIRDYLAAFPPDPAQSVHIEPGSWAGADNGDPQFAKWFSRYREAYSPDLNSWAVLTAFHNVVHTLEDAGVTGREIEEARRLMLMAETSCYWYWTGQDVWDGQVTQAANAGVDLLRSALDPVLAGGSDRTGPTIFPPWVLPENPGGKTWGQGGLADAPRDGVLHVFLYDVSGIRAARLVVRAGAKETVIPLENRGPYPSRTGPRAVADLYTASLPAGDGHLRYFVEAEDGKGNINRGSLERIYMG